jgi:HEAT repeat protein
MLFAPPGRTEPVHGEYPLSVWIGLLEDSGAWTRRKAAEAVASFGPQAAHAVPALIALLGDREPLNRSAASEALVEIGPVALPDLVQALRDPLPVRRRGIVRVLSRFQGVKRDAALLKILDDPDAEVSLAAAEGLLDRPEARPAVLARLVEKLEKGERRRLDVVRLLVRLGPEAAVAVPELRKMLRSPKTDDGLFRAAAEALRRIGPAARVSIPELRALLTAPETSLELCVSVAAALLALGETPESVFPVLLEHFEPRREIDPAHDSSERLLRAFESIPELFQRQALAMLLTGRPPPDDPEERNTLLRLRWPTEPRTLSVLERALNSPKDEVRALAARALGRFEELPVEVIAELRRLADDDVDTAVRRWAAIALCRLPGALRPADVAELIDALADGDSTLPELGPRLNWQAAAIPALAEAAVTTVPHLARALKSEQREVRAGAAETLALIALSSPEAIHPALPALKEMARLDAGANESHPSQIRAAAWAAVALVRLEVDPLAVRGTLIHARILVEERLNDPAHGLLARPPEGHSERAARLSLRRAVDEALGRLEDDAVPPLLAALNEGRPEAGTLAALVELIRSRKAPTALPALVQLLGHGKDGARSGAALVLRRLTTAELQPALPAVLRALEDRDADVRLQAALILVETGQHLDQARSVLLELFKNHVEERGWAAHALCRIGVPAARAPELLELAAQSPTPERLRVYFRAAPDPLTPLEALLDHPDRRTWAGSTLQQLGPAGLAVLGHALRHGGPAARPLAARLLNNELTLPAPAVTALHQSLTDPDPQVAGHAAVGLAWLGHGDASAVRVLRRVLSSGDREMRRLAAHALGWADRQAEEATAALLRALADEEMGVRMAAASALGLLGGKDCLPALQRCYADDPEPAVRVTAIQAVGSIVQRHPDDQPAAVQPLLVFLNDPNPDLQLVVGDVLAKMSYPKIQSLVLTPLTAVLEQPGHPLASKAAQILSCGGGEILPYLTRLLKSPHARTRGWAISILRFMKVDRTWMPPLLRLGLGDDSAEVREATYSVLRHWKDASVAVPLLRERLECDPAVRRTAALGLLAELGAEAREALPALLSHLGHRDDEVRRAALEAVLAISPVSPEALPGFTALLKDPTPKVRELAVQGLAALGPPALPALLQALRDDSDSVQKKALAGLAELPRLPAEALPLLVTRMRESERSIRAGAARALSGLGERGGPAVPALTAALRDDDPDVRAAAARTLGALGTPARAAVAELKTLRRDGHESVRRAAAAALAKLTADHQPSR